MKHQRVIHGHLLLALLFLTCGCAHFTPPAPPTTPPSPLEYCAWLRDAGIVELNAERHRLEYVDSGIDEVTRRVRLALLLSLRGEPGEREMALRLLGDLTAEPDPARGTPAHTYLELGRLWRDWLSTDLDREAAVEAEFREKLAEERQQREILEEKNAELRGQIEALKSIERKLYGRAQPSSEGQ